MGRRPLSPDDLRANGFMTRDREVGCEDDFAGRLGDLESELCLPWEDDCSDLTKSWRKEARHATMTAKRGGDDGLARGYRVGVGRDEGCGGEKNKSVGFSQLTDSGLNMRPKAEPGDIG